MKVLVKICIPAISEKYDMWIPDFVPVSELIPLIIKNVVELSGGKYVSSGSELLCTKTPPLLLKPRNTLERYQIKNGDSLLLI